jgi:hypothetical protein
MKRDSNGAFRDWEKASELEDTEAMSIIDNQMPENLKR